MIKNRTTFSAVSIIVTGGFMSKHNARFVIFSIGACGYGLLEILWRGYTHWSMLWAGGIAFLGLSSIAEKRKKAGLFACAVMGSAFITTIELLFGVLFNVILKKNVWDYSKLPFNIGGQVCLLYSFLWLLLSLLFIPFAGTLNKRLQNK